MGLRVGFCVGLVDVESSFVEGCSFTDGGDDDGSFFDGDGCFGDDAFPDEGFVLGFLSAAAAAVGLSLLVGFFGLRVGAVVGIGCKLLGFAIIPSLFL